jgi:hypothetical protein
LSFPALITAFTCDLLLRHVTGSQSPYMKASATSDHRKRGSLVNNIRSRHEHVDTGRADGAGGRTLARRGVLGGIAALPVVYGIGAAAPALAATTAQATGSAQAATSTSTRPGGASNAAAVNLARGVEQRYNAPLLAPGTRLVLPEGIKAVAIEDYYGRPHLASGETSWPRMKAADGTTVDASIVPEPGAPTRVALLSGFRAGSGWYELVLPNKGAARRVTWDAAKFPFLFVFGEYGAADQAPYNRFYTLALQPYSRNPYSRNGLAL